MSTGTDLHRWLSALETFFGLQHRHYLPLPRRMLRVFGAIWFRPYSIVSFEPIGTPSKFTMGRLLLWFFHFVWTALRDLISPFYRFMLWLLTPLKLIKQASARHADAYIRKYKPQRALEQAAIAMSKDKRIYIPLLLVCAVLFFGVAQASLPLAGQWIFVAVCYLVAQLFKRMPQRIAHISLTLLTLLILARYVFWRFTSSLDLESGMEIFLGYALVFAESYTWLILILGFIQTAWPLNRQPLALDSDPASWPSVDVFIPSYNEPLSVVKPTVYAAKGLDWPIEKITVYILDDGHRPAFEEFAKQAGVEYISRPDNSHAKAGNINYALKHTHGELIAIFDCDHIPTRSFLQTTVGWLQKDPKTVLVQTPHHFFSADPFERNFGFFRQMPNEGDLFYGLVQDGNDFWNASFFCGSCAVIRRGPLEEVGGIAVETVTEDAHTALKLHSLGYKSVYLNTIQAAGLATETLAGHIGQRIRWARGMAQIFRVDNPFLKKGLDFFQRICYANAMLHFFYGIPRLMFLVMPMAYLYFEMHLLNAAALTILSYALPQLAFASYTNSIIQGPYRRSFWSEVYETVLSWYIVRPTTLAFINPKLGKFNVTSKGGLIEDSYFDADIAKPYLILLLLNLVGFVIGIGRLFFWNSHEMGTVLMNLAWCFFNLSILGAAVGVASEAPQKNVYHRVKMIIPAFIKLPGGYIIHCYTDDYSAAGLTLAITDTSVLRDFTEAEVGLSRGDREFLFPAKLEITNDGRVEAHFMSLSPLQETQLIQCTFGRADAWLNWKDLQTEDRALSGLLDVLVKGWVGYQRLFSWIYKGVQSAFSRALTGRKNKRKPFGL